MKQFSIAGTVILIVSLLASVPAYAIPICEECSASQPPTTPCWCPDFVHTSTCGWWQEQCFFRFAPVSTEGMSDQEIPSLEDQLRQPEMPALTLDESEPKAQDLAPVTR